LIPRWRDEYNFVNIPKKITMKDYWNIMRYSCNINHMEDYKDWALEKICEQSPLAVSKKKKGFKCATKKNSNGLCYWALR